ncbi:MAG: EamA family transporter [Lachnospiraceae bacterium]|nr:EamA family transporter [Lachnospiraceae bacterium]
MNSTAFYFFLYILSVVIASFSQILLKKSATRQYTSVIREYLNPYVIIGYGMLFGSMLLTIMAFKGMEFKNGAIIESLGYVLVILLSRIFFSEKITKNKVIGTVCILAGITIYYL